MYRVLSVICTDEKKEPVLDCDMPRAQVRILLNLVSGSMSVLATSQMNTLLSRRAIFRTSERLERCCRVYESD